MNKRSVLIVLGVTIISLSLIGLSYAFYQAVITEENVNEISISSGDLELELIDTNAISIPNARPGDSKNKDFTVENHGIATFYNIKFTDITNSFVGEDLKYTLTDTDTQESEEGFINDDIIKNDAEGHKYFYIKTKINIEAKKGDENPTHHYNLKLEFLDKPNINQNDNQGAEFLGKINIDQVDPLQDNPIYATMMSNPDEVAADDPDNNLRYIGADPANYIWFNCDDYNGITQENAVSGKHCEKWRIIGLFNNIEKVNADGSTNKENLVKIVRAESLTPDLSWDNKNTSTDAETNDGKNDWTTAELMYLLNPNNDKHKLDNVLANNSLYWNSGSGECSSGQNNATTKCDFTSTGLKGDDSGPTKSMIENVKWNLGGLGSTYTSTGNPKVFYEAERGATAYTGRPTTWTGKVGLIYPSDFGFATTGGTTGSDLCLAKEMLHWYIGQWITDCAGNDWLAPSIGDFWTITPFADDSVSVFLVYTGGSVNNYHAFNPRSVRPSLYLSSKVGIKEGGGTGEAMQPYILEMVE